VYIMKESLLSENVFRWKEFDAYYCTVVPSGSLYVYVESLWRESVFRWSSLHTSVPSGSMYVYAKRVFIETESVFRWSLLHITAHLSLLGAYM